MPPDRSSAPRERALNVPGLLLGAIVALLAIHAIRDWLPEETQLRVLLEFRLHPRAVDGGPRDGRSGRRDSGRWPGGERSSARGVQGRASPDTSLRKAGWRPWSVVSYSVLHGSWVHVAFNCLWLAAFGAPVVRRAGNVRTIVLALAAAIGGALAQWLSDPLSAQPMVGISAVVSGLMAAAATFMFARPRPAWMGSASRRRGADWSFLRNRNALVFLGIWFAVNLLFGAFANPFGIGEGGIAWQAHIGGLLAGLAVFPWLDPGGRAQAVPLRRLNRGLRFATLRAMGRGRAACGDLGAHR